MRLLALGILKIIIYRASFSYRYQFFGVKLFKSQTYLEHWEFCCQVIKTLTKCFLRTLLSLRKYGLGTFRKILTEVNPSSVFMPHQRILIVVSSWWYMARWGETSVLRQNFCNSSHLLGNSFQTIVFNVIF